MARVIRVFAFGLWTGVMVGFAFIFAPIAFAALGPVTVFAGIVAHVIGAITLFGYGCAAAVVIAAIFDAGDRVRSAWFALIALVMAALGWYVVHGIVPIMQRTQLATPAYEALHQESSAIYSVILLLGFGALMWSSWQPRKG